ncbi:YqzL family protein [Shouchella sp. JSM 1781072]|nr:MULTISPECIES: YqzL family protein [Bacillaceae]UTR07945.1 YqzL family protein [Alkalihalobacillus sp. LMS6]
MLVLSWKVFSQTGNIETYLLHKELERDNDMDEGEVVPSDDQVDPTLS